MTIRYVVSLLCCLSAGGFCHGQEAEVAPDRQFKLELLEQAAVLKEAKESVDLMAEAIVALGVATEPRWKSLAPGLFLDSTEDDSRKQFRVYQLARVAASYRRYELAKGLFDKLPRTIEKFNLAVWLAFSYGFESRKTEALAVLREVQEWEGQEITWIGGDPKEDEVWEMSRQRLDRLRDEVLCAYHCGRASSGQQLDPEFTKDSANDAFRDLIRMYRINWLVTNGNAAETLAAIQTLESEGLRLGATFVAAEELIDKGLEDADKATFGKALFKSLNAVAKEPAPLDERFAFRAGILFEGIDRVERSEPIVELVDDAFEAYNEFSDVLELCIQLGFCRDGFDVAASIEDRDLRERWLDAVLVQVEKAKEFSEAWVARERIRKEFSYEKESSDLYLERLVRRAVQHRRFGVAQKLVREIQNDGLAARLLDHLSIRRGNDEDLKRARELAPKLFEDFDSQLALVEPHKQLEWLLKVSIVFRGKRDIHPLYGRIVREVEQRRESRSRVMVAEKAGNARRSFTKPDKVSLELLADIIRVLDVERPPKNQSLQGINSVLDRLDSKNTSPKQLRRYYELLLRFVDRIAEPDDRDDALANLALTMAMKGQKQWVVELNTKIKDEAVRFRSLLDCATAYPKASRPIRGPAMFEAQSGDGLLGSGFF